MKSADLKQRGVVVLHSALLGAVVGIVFNGGWFLFTGNVASALTTLVVCEAAFIVYAATEARRAHKERAELDALFQQPSFGQGVQPPHRPPPGEPDTETP